MSTELDQYHEDLENQKAGNQKMVAIGERLDRLVKNADFREIVLQFWMVDEAARYAQLSQDPALAEENQKDCINMAAAAGHFKRWMHAINTQVNVARDGIIAVDAELDRLRSDPNGGEPAEEDGE